MPWSHILEKPDYCDATLRNSIREKDVSYPQQISCKNTLQGVPFLVGAIFSNGTVSYAERDANRGI